MIAARTAASLHAVACLKRVKNGSARPRVARRFYSQHQTSSGCTGTSEKCPCVDGSGLARAFHLLQHWSVQPCVRPFDAVHAGHNALRGSGPDQTFAFKNAMAHVGCPDRRIDRLCITCCSPSQPSHRASATGSLYRSPLAIMAHAIRAILLASAIAATLVGRRASNAVSQGRCLVPWILA